MKIGGDTVELSRQYRVYLGVMTGLGYALVHCLFRLLSKESIDPIQVVFQVVFFAFFWYFVFFLWTKKQKKSLLDDSRPQGVSFYGAAHQVIKTSGVMGVLYATEKQLVFSPETTNFVASPLAIDFENITQVEVCKTIGLFEYGIRIYTQGNMAFKFRVNEPQVWQTSIQSKIK